MCISVGADAAGGSDVRTYERSGNRWPSPPLGLCPSDLEEKQREQRHEDHQHTWEWQGADAINVWTHERSGSPWLCPPSPSEPEEEEQRQRQEQTAWEQRREAWQGSQANKRSKSRDCSICSFEFPGLGDARWSATARPTLPPAHPAPDGGVSPRWRESCCDTSSGRLRHGIFL